MAVSPHLIRLKILASKIRAEDFSLQAHADNCQLDMSDLHAEQAEAGPLLSRVGL